MKPLRITEKGSYGRYGRNRTTVVYGSKLEKYIEMVIPMSGLPQTMAHF
jgi:hypothetical protein